MAGISLIFPGQGAQHVGMGAEVYERSPSARDIFDRADEVLGFKLSRVCFEGPEDVLSRADVNQPAILTTSAAVLAALVEQDGGFVSSAVSVAGLSLGEYTALYAAGSIDLESAVRLVRRRGQLMREVASRVPSGMLCIVGLDAERVRDLCEQVDKRYGVAVTNLNCPRQVVVGGGLEGIAIMADLAEKAGASKAIVLNVEGASHCSIMAPAARALKPELDSVELKPPRIPVVANATADFVTEPDAIRALLVKQLCSPVLWERCVRRMMSSGTTTFYEVGPGRVLRGLVGKIDRKFPVVTVNSVVEPV